MRVHRLAGNKVHSWCGVMVQKNQHPASLYWSRVTCPWCYRMAFRMVDNFWGELAYAFRVYDSVVIEDPEWSDEGADERLRGHRII